MPEIAPFLQVAPLDRIPSVAVPKRLLVGFIFGRAAIGDVGRCVNQFNSGDNAWRTRTVRHGAPTQVLDRPTYATATGDS